MIGRLKYELQDALFFRMRYAIYALAAVGLVLLSGWLAQGSVPVNVVLFTDGVDPNEVSQLSAAIQLVPDATVLTESGSLDPETLRRDEAVLGIGKVLGRFTAMENSASSQDAYFATFLRSLPRLNADAPQGPFNAVATLASILATPLSANVLVDAGRRPFLPAMIALLAVFAPFLVAFETYGRQNASGLLGMAIAANRGRAAAAVFLRLVMAIVGGALLLVVLLAVARAAFGTANIGSWPVLVVWYLPAALFSACAGAIIAFWTKSESILGSSAGYLFALVIFGGVLAPVSASAPIVQWISFAVPTRYFLPILRRWMFEGQLPQIPHAWSLLQLRLPINQEMSWYLVASALAVVAVLASASLARRRY